MITAEQNNLLIKYLHHSSPDAMRLEREEHLAAMKMCDGFCQKSGEYLIKNHLTWDFSHVRDSSERAKERAARYLASIGCK